MEQSHFVVAAAVAIIFAISKFIEKKYILKEEEIAMKNVIRDSLMVYVSTVIGLFIIEQVGETVNKQSPTNVFIGKADF
uniref:Uncharacterized protein n=1 Tax=viral metagenome TaxID=1070528 RepID=A0A6C0CQV7_9ZZZZ